MKTNNLKKVCTTFNNSFVLEQLLQEFGVTVIERIDNVTGITVIVDTTLKLIKEVQNEFKCQCNHPLILID
jgi:hypothetical protein